MQGTVRFDRWIARGTYDRISGRAFANLDRFRSRVKRLNSHEEDDRAEEEEGGCVCTSNCI